MRALILREVFLRSGGGVDIVPAGNTKALLDKMQLLADSPDVLREMSANALLATKNMGSWDAAATKLVTELKKKMASGVVC